MLEHTRQLLERVGYGSSGEPDFAIGIGLDFGEAFIGNIGDTAVHDFTAVGDVVNTASRLQSHAAGGEVVLSARLARLLPEPVGVPDSLVLKGKQEPVDVRRVRWFAGTVTDGVRAVSSCRSHRQEEKACPARHGFPRPRSPACTGTC